MKNYFNEWLHGFVVISAFIILSASSCSKEEVVVEPTPTPEPSAPKEWKDAQLVWNDEFDGDKLDLNKWKYETGSSGWGNNEWQNYTSGENVLVSNGTLKVIATKIGTGQRVGDYTSARLNSKQSFTYGRMEIRAKMPIHKGPGLWPAIWMLGENISTVGWPKCGEIDIMEYVSFDPGFVHQTIHSEANNHTKGTQISSGAKKLETIEEEFHNYGVLWDSKALVFYVDSLNNVLLNFSQPIPVTTDNWPFSRGFYFLLNVAVGGNWGGLKGVDDAIFPAEMEIDYVRVYQHR